MWVQLIYILGFKLCSVLKKHGGSPGKHEFSVLVVCSLFDYMKPRQ